MTNSRRKERGMRLIDADELKNKVEAMVEHNARESDYDYGRNQTLDYVADILIDDAPTIDVGWIPCSERLPEERDWYLGIFEEPDTGWINPLPFICDYLLGTKTKVTTKEGWILRGFTDREEYIDYYFNLECVAWMPLPKPYREDGEV